MDSNTSEYLLNHTALHSVYYQAKEDDSIIDLGLSLKALQPEGPEAYHPSGHGKSLVRLLINSPYTADDYGDLIDWQELTPGLRSPKIGYPNKISEDYDDETEAVQSKERWTYVKVNMDGVIVGRKICIIDHMGYSTLAVQLEDMFGSQTISGLKLFQAGSEFSLFYKDRDENWRTVGDVPWKEFVDRVKRLRIVPNNEALVPSSSAFA